MTPKEALAKWIGDNAANINAGYLTEMRGLGAERIIESLAAAGYVIVPAEPTDGMLDAGVSAKMKWKERMEAAGVNTRMVLVADHPAGTIYQAMLAASPK